MRRYQFENTIEVGQEIEISGELFKHTVVVCRNQIGDKIELINSGKAYLSEFTEVLKKSARLLVKSQREVPRLKKPYLHLVLANPKVAVLERVVEKSVELGVKTVFLLATEKSFFKSAEKIKLKEGRLNKIIKQALQQSDRFETLDLAEPRSYGEFLSFLKAEKAAKPAKIGAFMLYERLYKPAVKASSPSEDFEDVYLIVGAEGGFSSEEAELASEAGVDVLSLGAQILRVETACVAGLSILKSKLQIW